MHRHPSRRLNLAFILFAFTGLLHGCARSSAGGPSPLADRELTESTDIYLDSEQYYLQAGGPASHENDFAPANSEALSQSQKSDESLQTNKKASKTSNKTAAKSPAKKRQAPPVDIEYVLSRAKDIDVGLSSGDERARTQNEDRSFVPASITKIVTTSVALKLLGAGFQFRTQVGFDLNSMGQATNVIVSSDGDPTTGVTDEKLEGPIRLRQIATALKNRGVREVLGEIRFVSVDPRLDVVKYAPGIQSEDMRECYGSLATSFNFRGNCARVRVHSKSGFTWENPAAGQFISTGVETAPGSANILVLEPMLSPERLFQGFKLGGNYAEKSPRVWQLRLPIGNAASWFGQGFLAALRNEKIELIKVTTKFVVGARERTQALAEISRQGPTTVTVESVPLATLVEATNKPSDNFFADAIFKAIGSRRGLRDSQISDASRDKIKEVVDSWLRSDGHLTWSNELLFYEGAGLSNANRATPRAFLALLRQMAREPSFPNLWNSLPIVGQDGTMTGRMRETVADGRVRAKTGTLKGSYQLVGFIPRTRGGTVEYVPFVILTSTTVSNRNKIQRFQDALVVKMTETLNQN